MKTKMDVKLVRDSLSDLTRYTINRDPRAKQSLITYYSEARKSPSVANMYLFNDYKSKLKKYYDESVNDLETGYYTYDEYKKRENDIKGSINYIQELNDDPDVFVALANYGTAFESTYPDTWFLRNILITEGRCPNDKTLPKMKWWEKIKFLYKLKKEAKKD